MYECIGVTEKQAKTNELLLVWLSEVSAVIAWIIIVNML